MAAIALLFGLVVTFFGYRLFLFLLPVWGFFFGLFLGAQTVQVIFGQDFLATVTSWVVGFIVGAIFALLSYLFYVFAVAVLSFSLGYGASVGILEWIGMDFGFLLWLIAVVVGVVVVLAVLYFNLQKYAIIAITAIGGTAAMIYTILMAVNPSMVVLDLVENPVRAAVDDSWLWLLFFLFFAIAGIVFQVRANRAFEIETYNRMAEVY
jgi:hypothetical protein